MRNNNNKRNIRLYKLIKDGKTVDNLLCIYKTLRGKRNIRLYKLIKDEKTVDNLLNIYKVLRGKENAEKRLFLKTLVYCGINRLENTNRPKFIKPEDYFGNQFTMGKFETLWTYFKGGRIELLYGQHPQEEFGKLV